MVDYSKWKKIEISDDEDDTHPNIDTPSLFRWRHQARQERDMKFRSEMQSLEERKKNASTLSAEDSAKLEQELAEIAQKEKELERQARLRPFNVDSLGKETWESTLINSPTPKPKTSNSKEYTDEDLQGFEKFVELYEQHLKDYSFLNGIPGSRKFILEHAHLVNQFTVDWLIMRCVDYKINGSIALMKHVAYQAVIIEMILDISKSVGRGCDPRNCLPIFFERYTSNTALIDGVIDEQVENFLERVEKGANYRIEKAYEKQEEDDEPIVGPGGLDPNVVFQELDPELQDAFLDRDVDKLRQAMQKYPPEEAEKILDRCIDAGLWMDSVNSDLEEYAESFEKEQQRQAALAELQPEEAEEEVVTAGNQEAEEEFEVRDVFSKLIINPNREVKQQPGIFQKDDEEEEKGQTEE